MEDLYDHPMSQMARSEATDTHSDQAWSRYVRACKQDLGIPSLDGTEWVEGYSLDSAHDAWRAGISPAQYATGRRA